MHFALIFLSGGAILALELLASRIMTPYFGVSLYIWTGILSITLVSLALGYWWGGRLAGNRQKLGLLFSIMPALAGIAIVFACAIYPFAFHPLASWSLVGGAFAACMILLFLPLVATSAMNPLLVALLLQQQNGRSGDAGAGMVFFISTLGSVAGVIVTAFALIPHVSNYTAVLLVALLLGLLSLVAAMTRNPSLKQRGAVTAAGVIAVAGALLFIWQADRYTGRLGPVSFNGADWQIEATHSSLFGTVKVLRSGNDSNGRFLRLYFQDGLVQNTADSAHHSISFYTWALEALTRAYHPQPRKVLVLGLGAGIVPTRFAQAGADVEVVEIDPSSTTIAQRYFGFDPARTKMHQADARTFVAACRGQFDTAIVDLFNGDGTPEYLITREFFHALGNCLKPGGIAVFNTFANLDNPRSYTHLLATLSSELPHVVMHRPDWPGAREINSFLVAARAPLQEPRRVTITDVPERHTSTLWDMLARPRTVDASLTAQGIIIHDTRNAAALDLAASQAAFRRGVLATAPPALLMN